MRPTVESVTSASHLSPSQLAEVTGLSRHQIRRRIISGEIKATLSEWPGGALYLIPKDEARRFAEEVRRFVEEVRASLEKPHTPATNAELEAQLVHIRGYVGALESLLVNVVRQLPNREAVLEATRHDERVFQADALAEPITDDDLAAYREAHAILMRYFRHQNPSPNPYAKTPKPKHN